MQKTKKQLLGFAGLAAVGIMTAVAYAMPAAAVDTPPSADNSVNLNVTVRNGVNNARILSPQDKSVTVNPVVPITYQYEETTKVEMYIEYKDDNGQLVKKLVDTFAPTDISGSRTVNLNVTNYTDRENDYKVIVVATDERGSTSEDTITFSYRAVNANFEPKPAINGDPIIDIEVNGEVEQVIVHIYDEAGNPLFVDKDGNEVPVVLSSDDIDPATGKIIKDLPFGDYNAKDGKYTAVVVARSADGNTISMIRLDTNYAYVNPNVPDTPDTGFTINNLNITRVDYLVTGLIVFGMVAGFALYLVRRKSRR